MPEKAETARRVDMLKIFPSATPYAIHCGDVTLVAYFLRLITDQPNHRVLPSSVERATSTASVSNWLPTNSIIRSFAQLSTLKFFALPVRPLSTISEPYHHRSSMNCILTAYKSPSTYYVNRTAIRHLHEKAERLAVFIFENVNNVR